MLPVVGGDDDEGFPVATVPPECVEESAHFSAQVRDAAVVEIGEDAQLARGVAATHVELLPVEIAQPLGLDRAHPPRQELLQVGLRGQVGHVGVHVVHECEEGAFLVGPRQEALEGRVVRVWNVQAPGDASAQVVAPGLDEFLEALGEIDVGAHVRIAGGAPGRIAGVAQDLGQRRELAIEVEPLLGRAMAYREDPGEERRMARDGPRGGGVEVREADRLAGKGIQLRRGRPLVAIGREPVAAHGVEHDQEHVRPGGGGRIHQPRLGDDADAEESDPRCDEPAQTARSRLSATGEMGESEDGESDAADRQGGQAPQRQQLTVANPDPDQRCQSSEQPGAQGDPGGGRRREAAGQPVRQRPSQEGRRADDHARQEIDAKISTQRLEGEMMEAECQVALAGDLRAAHRRPRRRPQDQGACCRAQ